MAVIGGQVAHQNNLNQIPIGSNYCNNGLIMNHHIDCQEDIHPILTTNISK